MPPIRDQDSVGWCYAFTAADLVGFKIKRAVSPIDIAISTERSKESYYQALKGLFASGDHRGVRLNDDGDNTSHAIETAAQKGFCRDRDLPSDDFRYARYRSNLKDLLNQIGRLQKNLGNSGNSSKAAAVCQAQLHQFFPNLTSQDMSDILNSFAWRPLIDQMVDATCKSRIKVPNLHVHKIQVTENSASDRTANISKILDSGRPAGIGYNAAIVVDKHAAIHQLNGHHSSIVGRHWNKFKGQCEFILRNSWGSDCSSIDPSYECDTNGYVYIPESRISSAVGWLYYVE